MHCLVSCQEFPQGLDHFKGMGHVNTIHRYTHVPCILSRTVGFSSFFSISVSTFSVQPGAGAVIGDDLLYKWEGRGMIERLVSGVDI